MEFYSPDYRQRRPGGRRRLQRGRRGRDLPGGRRLPGGRGLPGGRRLPGGRGRDLPGGRLFSPRLRRFFRPRCLR